jgi:hypothetical protein
MTTAAIAGAPARLSSAKSIVVAGLVVGAVDLAYAILVYSPHHPLLIPQHIASGVLGPASFKGGITTALLGVFLHFLIAFGAATAYYLASRKLRFLIRHAVLCGILYGGWVYIFMHTVVVPLSRVARGHMPVGLQVAEFVEHLFCVGLPIALAVRYYSASPTSEPAV